MTKEPSNLPSAPGHLRRLSDSVRHILETVKQTTSSSLIAIPMGILYWLIILDGGTSPTKENKTEFFYCAIAVTTPMMLFVKRRIDRQHWKSKMENTKRLKKEVEDKLAGFENLGETSASLKKEVSPFLAKLRKTYVEIVNTELELSKNEP